MNKLYYDYYLTLKLGVFLLKNILTHNRISMRGFYEVSEH